MTQSPTPFGCVRKKFLRAKSLKPDIRKDLVAHKMNGKRKAGFRISSHLQAPSHSADRPSIGVTVTSEGCSHKYSPKGYQKWHNSDTTAHSAKTGLQIAQGRLTSWHWIELRYGNLHQRFRSSTRIRCCWGGNSMSVLVGKRSNLGYASRWKEARVRERMQPVRHFWPRVFSPRTVGESISKYEGQGSGKTNDSFIHSSIHE